MNRLKAIYKPYMLRPILYKTAARGVLALLLTLLWDRYINTNGYLSLWKHGFFAAGAVLLGMAWFCYLRLDGVGGHKIFKKRENPKKKRHPRRTITDFADEKIISFEELEPEERILACLCSDLLAGAVFLVPALAAGILA